MKSTDWFNPIHRSVAHLGFGFFKVENSERSCYDERQNGSSRFQLKTIEKRDPMNEEGMLDAKVDFAQGNYKQCIEKFDKILDSDPENLIALFTRGTAKFRKGDFEGAISDFTDYISKKSDNEKVFCCRGNAYMAQDKSDEAMADFDRAIELNPQYPTVYFSRSELFLRLNETEQAEADQAVGNQLQRQIAQAYYETQGIMFQNF